MPEFITVTAPEGRSTPINPNDGSDPAGALLIVTKERIARVRYSADVRRSVRDGDLIPVKLAESIDPKGAASYTSDLRRVSVEEAASDKPLANGDRVDIAPNASPVVRPDPTFDRLVADVASGPKAATADTVEKE